MQVNFVTKDYVLDDGLRGLAEKKLERLDRFLQEPITAHFVLEVETHHQRNVAELTVHHAHGHLRAGEETHDMKESLRLVIDKMEKQARRALKKFQTNRRQADRLADEKLGSGAGGDTDVDGSTTEGPLTAQDA